MTIFLCNNRFFCIVYKSCISICIQLSDRAVSMCCLIIGLQWRLKAHDVMHACKIENGEQSEPRTSGRLLGYATSETACILLQRCVQGVQ